MRYVGDQNKIVLMHESGTYANTSGTGIWPGQVMDNSIDESEGLIETRYMGGSSRNFQVMEQGPRDYKGKLTFRTQDMRLLGFTVGSITDTSGTNFTHVISENNNDVRQSAFTSGALNPGYSFTVEDSKTAAGTGKNYVRTLVGCVPERYTLKLKQNSPVEAEIDYVGQALTITSGATTSVTANANRPYLWSDASLTVNGSVLQTTKDISFEVDTGLVAPHYINGSRNIAVPFLTNRNYTLTVTLDADSEEVLQVGSLFYNDLGFNTTLDMNADGKAGVTGSMHTIIAMSGCRLFKPVTTSVTEGVQEQTITIRPQTISATVYDRVTGPGSGYNPW